MSVAAADLPSVARPRSALLLLAPLPAIAIGAFVAKAHGVPPAAFAPNLAAVLLGAIGYVVLRDRAARVMPFVALAAIAATMLAAPIDGVHRWIGFGPVRLHASAALVPWLLVPTPNARLRVALGVAMIATQAIHVLQPDAAQATAFALGAIGFAVHRRSGFFVAALLGGMAVAAWARPDPLAPVAHVEHVLPLVAARGEAWFAALLLALALLVAPFVVAAKNTGGALAMYLLGAFAATLFGSFPVPVFGAGAGPVLGWYALACVMRASR